MDLIDQSVVNKVYGRGIIKSQDSNYVYVAFKVGEKKFKYPEAFDVFLKLEDKELQTDIEQKILNLKLKNETLKMMRDGERQKMLEKNQSGKSRMNLNTCVNIAFKFENFNYEPLEDNKVKIGTVKTGLNKGKPVKLSRIQNGGLCILTTKTGGVSEKDRCVYGAFLIENSSKTKNTDEGFLYADSHYKISLTQSESNQIKFWESNDKKPSWSSGTHRYFENEQAVKILKKIIELKKGTAEETLANEMYKRFCEEI